MSKESFRELLNVLDRLYQRKTYTTEMQYNVFFPTVCKPNVVVEWLALLLGIWKVPSSNLGPETAYPD
jgi:hypothetical protein